MTTNFSFCFDQIPCNKGPILPEFIWNFDEYWYGVVKKRIKMKLNKSSNVIFYRWTSTDFISLYFALKDKGLLLEGSLSQKFVVF